MDGHGDGCGETGLAVSLRSWNPVFVQLEEPGQPWFRARAFPEKRPSPREVSSSQGPSHEGRQKSRTMARAAVPIACPSVIPSNEGAENFTTTLTDIQSESSLLMAPASDKYNKIKINRF